jgi:hypothetical protein
MRVVQVEQQVLPQVLEVPFQHKAEVAVRP